MRGFVKLDCDILHSSIWQEEDHIRLVWITMLAMADAEGTVHSTAPGISSAAVIEIDRTREALRVLESPDEDSKNPINEGRRIERCDGGYQILNYKEHRAKREPDTRREYMKTYMQERRAEERRAAGKPNINIVSSGKPQLAHAEAEEEEEADKEKTPPTPPKGGLVFPEALDNQEFREAWGRWEKHRVEIRHKLTPTSTASQLSALAKIGPDQAIIRINHTIEMGWTGLRSPEARKKATYGGRDLVG